MAAAPGAVFAGTALQLAQQGHRRTGHYATAAEYAEPADQEPVAGAEAEPDQDRQGDVGQGRKVGAVLADEGHEVTVWDPRVIKPLDSDMLADAAGHRLVVTIEDGLRDGGAGSAITDALSKLAPVGGPEVRVLGVPSVYLSQGKPDVILSRLGLDSEGVADEVRSHLSSASDATN